MNERLRLDGAGRAVIPTAGKGGSIEFLGVSKRYAELVALHPITLTIAAGEFFAIIGPSGSGKSTLLGITAGFVAPSDGSIRIEGTEIVGIPPYRRNIGMVFQNYALFPHMSVAENIAFPLRMRGYSKVEIAERLGRLLRIVRLEGAEGRRPAQLSGGQQQRVALARAAAYDPLLLLMDEPLGALDKNLREEMQDEIKKFQAATGSTVLYVTHDQQEAAAMADRVAIMRAGRIEQLGTPRNLYERPETEFVASFLGEASIIPVEAVLSIEGGIATIRSVGGAIVKVPAREASPGPLAICLRPENIVLGPSARSLENAMRGVVEDTVFTAGSVRYRFRLADAKQSLTVRVPSRLGISVLSPGETVELGWACRDAVLVLGA